MATAVSYGFFDQKHVDKLGPVSKNTRHELSQAHTIYSFKISTLVERALRARRIAYLCRYIASQT